MITFIIVILNSMFMGTAEDTWVCYDEITEWNCTTVAELPNYEKADGAVLVYAGSRDHIQENYLNSLKP